MIISQHQARLPLLQRNPELLQGKDFALKREPTLSTKVPDLRDPDFQNLTSHPPIFGKIFYQLRTA